MRVLSVSQVTDFLAQAVTREPALQDLWVEGEVAEARIATTGHCYFTLKDRQSSVRCVMFRTDMVRVGFQITAGMTLLAHGRGQVYGGGSPVVFQLKIDQAQPSGVGGLYLAFDQLRKRLEKEGLFDQRNKRRVPFLPARVAVVTSEAGAALRDVLKVLRRRCPIVPVLLVHSPVQGEGAAQSLARAIGQASARDRVSVLLLVRGGGSIEDLVAFNDEGVARAIRASRVPVIVGVGHETDITIADYAADLRAPTPSAAAEMAVPDLAGLRRQTVDLRQRANQAVLKLIDIRRDRLGSTRERLGRQSPALRLPQMRQRIDERSERLLAALRSGLDRFNRKLESDRARLEALSPMAVLQRGYSLARDGEGRVLTSVVGLKLGDRLTTVFADGKAIGELVEVTPVG